MAEVALIGSIIGLAGTCAKYALYLYTIADDIGSAGKEARTFATEISLFSQSLSAVSKSLERKSGKNDRLVEIAIVVTKACESLLEDLQALIGDLTLAPPNFTSLYKRIKWVFQKPKICALRVSIESFKSTLILLVATIDSAEASYRTAPELIR
jgi:hypothetical protein